VDGVVVAEHRHRGAVVGGSGGIPVEALLEAGVSVAHIAGAIEDPRGRLRKHPPGKVAAGCMSVTTDVLGPRPVIDLHAAGLRVGQALVQARRRAGSAAEAEAEAQSAVEPLALRP
jgi:hypothetical protein